MLCSEVGHGEMGEERGDTAHGQEWSRVEGGGCKDVKSDKHWRARVAFKVRGRRGARHSRIDGPCTTTFLTCIAQRQSTHFSRLIHRPWEALQLKQEGDDCIDAVIAASKAIDV